MSPSANAGVRPTSDHADPSEKLSRARRALRDSIHQSEELKKRLREMISERDAAVFGSAAWLNTFFDRAPEAIITLDRDARVIDWNPAAERIFGWKREEVIGRPHPLVNDENRETFEVDFRRMLDGQTYRAHETRCRRRDGSFVELSFFNVPLLDEQGRVLGMTGIMVDRTEIKALIEQLHTLSLAVEQSPNLVFITDRYHAIQYANARFREATGYTREEINGKSADILKSSMTPRETTDALQQALDAGVEFRGELVNRRKNGDSFTVACHITPIRDEADNVTHFVCHQEDISHLQKLREAVTFHSSHDPLTGLYNRAAFEQALSELVEGAAESSTVHAVACIDIDQAEVIAAKFGLDTIHQVVRQVSERIAEVTRRSDVAARIGDDEFGILIKFCRPQQGERLAESIIKSVNGMSVEADGGSIKPTVSIGLAPIDRNSENAAAVLADARSACVLAKKRGRNCCVTLNEVDGEVKKRRQEMEWTTRILLAMEQDRLFLVWQRIEPIRHRNDLPHYEILIRLRDENGETVSPGQFLPAVEKHGLSVRLDSWVIEKALGWLCDHPDALTRLGMCSINLSGDSVGDPRVRELVLRRLRELALPANKICFAITETAAVNNFNEARRFIMTLKELGCRFAIDDFGSGVSSFGYLKHLPVDYLKIDGSFIRQIAEDKLDAVLVQSMNDVSHAMGKQTVAEFVENDAILKKLRKLGVDYAQGYAIGRPEPMLN